MSDNCIRCGYPLVDSEDKGCTVRRCCCLCEKYPACGCGEFDKNHPEVAIAVPIDTVLPQSGPKSITAQTQEINLYAGASPPSIEPTFVLMNYPVDSKGDIIFIGRDKAKAFDKLLAYGKDNFCQVSDLKMVSEAE